MLIHLKMNMQRKRDSGFTLLEILLAIFIFGIMITTLFGSFNQILGSVGVIEENLAFNEMAKTCLDRMILDMKGLYVTPVERYSQPEINTDPDIHHLLGEESSSQHKDFPKLRFTSASHIAFGKKEPKGVAEIVYYVDETDDNMMVLKRSDRLYFDKPIDENNQDPVICENVKSLVFTYYDKEGEEHASWNSESSEFKYETPVSIGIRLEIGKESVSHRFQTMVQLPVYRFEKAQEPS
ncbi:MAG: type II secretion system protein GspJ [Pseudomonadota bacterium]